VASHLKVRKPVDQFGAVEKILETHFVLGEEAKVFRLLHSHFFCHGKRITEKGAPFSFTAFVHQAIQCLPFRRLHD
jgi:hypothetical protein